MKNRSSSSCARRRSRNMPIWLPMVVSIESRSASGGRISRLKNSITLSTSPRSRMGNPNAAWSPSRAATGARGKFSSCVTSGIHTGSPFAHTRPGSPVPRGKVDERLTALNSGNCGGRRREDLGTAQDVVLAIDVPERAVLPVERAADRFEDPRHGLGERRGLDERAGNHVLGPQAALGQPVAAQHVNLRCHGEAGIIARLKTGGRRKALSLLHFP